MDEQTHYWNEQAGPKWVALQESLDRLLDPLGQVALDWAQPQPGERVLDVGCGCGSTSRELAQRLGPSGQVVGLDVSQPMLQRAQSLSTKIEWVLADAASHHFSTPFDLIFSRFGVMFFSQPSQALAHLRQQLRPQGRLVFLCWRALALNPFFSAGLAAAQPFLELPPASPTDVPGPFAFSPQGKVEQLLSQAGFSQVEVKPLDRAVSLGDLDQTADFLLRMGPVAPLYSECSPDTASQIRERLLGSLADFARDPEGKVLMPTATWLVKAQRD